MVPRAVDLAIIYVSVLAPCGFIVAYQVRTKGWWRRSVVGWHLMAVAVAELGPFLHLAAATVWPWLVLLAWFQWSYRASIVAMAAVSVWRTVLVFRRPAADQAPLPVEPGGD